MDRHVSPHDTGAGVVDPIDRLGLPDSWPCKSRCLSFCAVLGLGRVTALGLGNEKGWRGGDGSRSGRCGSGSRRGRWVASVQEDAHTQTRTQHKVAAEPVDAGVEVPQLAEGEAIRRVDRVTCIPSRDNVDSAADQCRSSRRACGGGGRSCGGAGGAGHPDIRESRGFCSRNSLPLHSKASQVEAQRDG